VLLLIQTAARRSRATRPGPRPAIVDFIQLVVRESFRDAPTEVLAADEEAPVPEVGLRSGSFLAYTHDGAVAPSAAGGSSCTIAQPWPNLSSLPSSRQRAHAGTPPHRPANGDVAGGRRHPWSPGCAMALQLQAATPRPLRSPSPAAVLYHRSRCLPSFDWLPPLPRHTRYSPACSRRAATLLLGWVGRTC
jgi:hypothetical protein